MLDSGKSRSSEVLVTTGTSHPPNDICSEEYPPNLQPIAIVGYACRLPGGASSPSKLWELCTRGRSGWSKIPSERFSLDAYHHPDPSKVGALNPTGGYFIQEDVTEFDAPFFNITAQEAISMDPQQRLLLECSYEALESAGFPKESLAGRNVGVFMGGSPPDYEVHNMRDLETVPMHQSTGCSTTLQSNRISYIFDFRGPSFTVETACSSSMVALHSAMQSMRNGESSEALVGGCRLNLLPDSFAIMSLSQLFNDEGRTYAFDHRGKSGFARGEGAGVVVLKPLDAALRDRDPIRAVILNSGINQDGKTQGITNPSFEAQAALIRQVYTQANLNPVDCGFVEMHGTGTKVGDPIEARAVHEVLGQGRSRRNPLYIGSVKSNVGHLESASGIVSLIKAVMMLEYDLMLPNADFEKAKEDIPLDEWNMKVLKTPRPWPRGKKYISVSNYGFGGTNAHVVLAKAPPIARPAFIRLEKEDSREPSRKLILISANDKESLQKTVDSLGVYIHEHPEVWESYMFGNFAYTMGSRKSNLLYRVALAASTMHEFSIQLAQMKINPARVLGLPSVGFVFTGQGAQWAQMGVPLMEIYPIFASALYRADNHLRSLGASFSLLDEMRKDPKVSQINSPHISQPACTALQVALVILLRSWGIEPSCVIGHSSGEIGAAFAAGIYGLESAVALAYHRGQMTQLLKYSCPDLNGTMIAVGAGRDTIKPILKTLKGGYATIACVNSPTSVTISGDVSAIMEIESILEEKQLFHRRLKIDVAYHSEHMARVADAYLSSIISIVPEQAPAIPFHSSVFGRLAESSEISSSYWVQNLTSPVLFSDVLEGMCKSDGRPTILIEIGPHSALKGPIKDTLKVLGGAATKIAYSPTVVRNEDPTNSLLNTAAEVHVRGGYLDMNSVNFPITKARENSMITDLPTYPWQHRNKYWHEARIPQKHLTLGGKRSDILGVLANYSNDLEPTWRNVIRLDELPWLRDHKLQGVYVFPLAGYLSMAIEAAQWRAEKRNVMFSKFELREVVISSALVLNENSEAELTISLRPYSEGTRGYSDVWDEFRICSWVTKRGWMEHCRGLVGVRSDFAENSSAIRNASAMEDLYVKSRIEKVIASAPFEVDMKLLYTKLIDIGAEFGPTFQGMESGFGGYVHGYGVLCIRDTQSIMPKGFQSDMCIHPAVLDAFLHAQWMERLHADQIPQSVLVPTLLKRATISRHIPKTPGERLRTYNMPSPGPLAEGVHQRDIFATKMDSTEVVIDFECLVSTNLGGNSSQDGQHAKKLCHKFTWQPLHDPEENHAAEMNGQVIITGRPMNNGQTMTNGSHIPNGNPHKARDGILILNFGNSESTAKNLQTIIGSKTDIHATLETLDSIDPAQRQVVIVQTGNDSLRHLCPARFEKMRNVLLNAASVLWVYRTDLPDAQMSVGLARSIRLEALAKIAMVGLDPPGLEDPSIVIPELIDYVWPADGPSAYEKHEFEFKALDGKLLVPRIIDDEAATSFVLNETQDLRTVAQPFDQPGRRFKIEIENAGSLDTFYFADEKDSALEDNEVEIKVYATGVNFKDVVVTMGQLVQPFIGIECSGIVTAIGKDVTNFSVGQRVMAMTEGAFSTYARCPSSNLAPIPGRLSFEEAATIPVVYCTAYYGLVEQARLTSGERVLIHAGAGGVGQAAIMLAKMLRAEIFVTVGSTQKKEFLMTQYGIPEDHIFYSRDTSFARAIRRATKGEGVDVVLNSLAGEMLRESWECLAPFGRFVEIGKADITKNSRLDMAPFESNVAFMSVDLSKASRLRPKLLQNVFDNVCSLFQDGVVRPISPITVLGISEVEAAFRILQSGKNIGKVVVVPRPGDQVKALAPKIGNDLLRPDASYILVGGTGGLGRSMAKWMSSKGARNIVLVSRQTTVSEKVQALIDELAAESGTRVFVKSCDIGSQNSVDKLVLEDMKDLPPVRGVIQGAMVLRDTLFEKMTFEEFQAVTTCKVDGTWNLHHTLANCTLDFFIALSSIAGVVGNYGQAAYSAANVFLDGFMEYRRSQGLPGTSIDLAAVSDVGYIADSDISRRQEIFKNLSGQTIDESEVLALLGAAITGQLDRSCNGQCITGLGLGGSPDSLQGADARFRYIYEAMKERLGSSQGGGGVLPLRELLKAASSRETALTALYETLTAKLSEVLVMPIEDMDPSISISSLGLDSLVGIEVRNWITREAEANVQILELLSSGSLMGLAELVLNKSAIRVQYK